jgi:NADPH-dependent 2,4-dienoyl-CoA reductase/sulfur reductase-like enzyme
VKGDVPELDDLVSMTPETFVEQRDIDLRTHHEVTAVDTDARTVTVDGPDGEFEQAYSDLLIATGARAVEPPLDGMDCNGVFTLHSMDAARKMREYLGLAGHISEGTGYGEVAREYADHVDAETVAIVGGGYVGIEMAEAFAEHGLDVHLFEMLPHVLQPFGAETAAVVEDHLEAKGVHLHLDAAVEELAGTHHRMERVVTAETEVPVDLVLVGVGVAPNTDLAESAGIELGDTGAIAVDEYGRTSDPHVYAAGDVAEADHVVTGEQDWVPLALTANRAGRAIGATLAGEETPVGAIAGTAALKAFDLEVARTGIVDEERAREAGFDPASVTITAGTRAHYYPGGGEIQITMVGDRETGRLLGATMVGPEGVAKRVDTVVAALFAGMSVEDVEYLDLSYAPPFSPVWDPVLTAAKVLGGQL